MTLCRPIIRPGRCSFIEHEKQESEICAKPRPQSCRPRFYAPDQRGRGVRDVLRGAAGSDAAAKSNLPPVISFQLGKGILMIAPMSLPDFSIASATSPPSIAANTGVFIREITTLPVQVW